MLAKHLLLFSLRPTLDLNYVTAAAPSGLSVTSQPEIVTLTGADFTRWFNPNEGTFVVEYSIAYNSTLVYRRVFSANDASTNNAIDLMMNGTGNGQAYGYVGVGGVEQAALTILAMTAATHRTALAYRINDFALSHDGATAVVDGAGALPVVTQLSIGGYGAGFLDGYIRRIRYYRRRLPNSTLQRLTAS